MDSASEQPLVAAVGQEIHIDLESFPGSGTIWEYRGGTSDTLVFLGETRTKIDETIGGPVRQSFRFRANRPGSYELLFDLKRPWERETRRSKRILLRAN